MILCEDGEPLLCEDGYLVSAGGPATLKSTGLLTVQGVQG